MVHKDDLELEKKLRSLPTTKPPAELRSRLLSSVRPRTTRQWKRKLAWALCVLGLLALDLGLQQVQSARLDRLMGDGQRISAPSPGTGTMMAFLQNRTALEKLLQNGDLR
ncbi:MAG: hypothetical protein GTO55_02415 [Armatimonadetes bacterium]|nr:hypothetical protein [Armatimonadota bacterium]NIM23133.1 hypothetical protein [Armatimonadota bacterium]NIM67001.1 hypothetical protein [Armatimonadota bacterium]NIM75535.1 hypothetical protein [Armatimonadota bacterium]NIN05190.1 hypothetical protein [Armatimonadota bacterium]